MAYQMKREDIDAVLALLPKMYPDAKVELRFEDGFTLLISTILAAQCTDKQVNKVTPALFERFPDPAAFAAATPEEVMPYIRSCGFYANKAKNIVACCKMLCENYGGEVPRDIEEMQKLPGVGRKTADVVGAAAFGLDAIAVDTHVFRVSNRIGLADAKDVLKTEYQLMENIPKDKWSIAHLWLIFLGRRQCPARKPKCDTCPLSPYCRYYKNTIGMVDEEA
ncbi:MAG: endonuclease III [Clostridiales bacterium]|nr:endonuclease III [Clostridiales bacterium]